MNTPKPRISIVIVNYNVEYFLEQCLISVRKALQHVAGETFVVDNNSIDGSLDMVRAKFPEVILIANQDNKGFSKANNQAMRVANGDYVLLLNPDTVVEEDTFLKVVEFMDEHPDAGGLGVRMIDGKGNFLPESKRGLPTPMVAFYKIFGLSSIFPKSKRFGKYHLGYLSEFETNEIEILSGAFMLMRKKALDKVGLLDEDFFMYGEDIDLSYRIILGGYKNYYFPDTRIIHYKGESTKKSSVNYVFVFYNAMIIFAKKHFSSKNASFLSFLINMAIYLRAGLAIASRFVKRIFLPAVDFTFLFGILYLLTSLWRDQSIYFPEGIIRYSIPVYILTWMLSNFYSGAYDLPIKISNFLKGTGIGTVVILVLYALLPYEFHFSRLFILVGTLCVFGYFFVSRYVLNLLFHKKYGWNVNPNQKFAVVGSYEESQRVLNLLHQTGSHIESVDFVSVNDQKEEHQIGNISQLDQIVFINKIDEVIFCARDVSAQDIIQSMIKVESKNTDFKIAHPESEFLIGSNSIDTAGDLYVVNINEISKQKSKRNKRTLDFLLALLCLIVSPVLIWCYRAKAAFFANILAVLFGKTTFVAYAQLPENSLKLPNLKKGILSPLDATNIQDKSLISKLNLVYARDYSIWKDLAILVKCWKKLDRRINF